MVGRAILSHPDDNVAVATVELAPGEEIEVVADSGRTQWVVARQHIPRWHKFALECISPGNEVTRYGVVIGRATQSIGAGEHVHVHNLIGLDDRDSE